MQKMWCKKFVQKIGVKMQKMWCKNAKNVV